MIDVIMAFSVCSVVAILLTLIPGAIKLEMLTHCGLMSNYADFSI
jgi:hypothetical protein